MSMFGESVRALLSTLIPIGACIMAGAAVRRGRSGWPGADMLVGFGLLAGALTVLAVTTRIPLSWLMGGLAMLSALALPIRRQFPGRRSTWLPLALVSPIVAGTAGPDTAMLADFCN